MHNLTKTWRWWIAELSPSARDEVHSLTGSRRVAFSIAASGLHAIAVAKSVHVWGTLGGEDSDHTTCRCAAW